VLVEGTRVTKSLTCEGVSRADRHWLSLPLARYVSLTGTCWRFVFDGIQCYFFGKLLISGLILFFLSDRVEGGVCVSR
jgi:hypothetical protein